MNLQIIIGAMYDGFRNFTREMIDYAKDKHLRDDNEEDKKCFSTNTNKKTK